MQGSYDGGSSLCTSFPKGYVTGDIRVVYYDSNHNLVRTDLLGVHVYDVAGSSSYWEDGCQSCEYWRKHLAAETVGATRINSSGYTSNSFDLKSLLATHLAPPSGYSIDQAVVVGLDVYTSVRGTDLDFSVKNADVVGWK